MTRGSGQHCVSEWVWPENYVFVFVFIFFILENVWVLEKAVARP